VNGFCSGTSERVHRAGFKQVFENGAVSRTGAANKKENTMLRKFAAALIATTLIAGPVFAAQSTGTAGTAPATAPVSAPATTPSAPASAAATVKTTKTVHHTVKHARKHLARGKNGIKTGSKSGTMHLARHVKPAKTHQANTGKTTNDQAAKRS
jgi:hypothetical protein